MPRTFCSGRVSEKHASPHGRRLDCAVDGMAEACEYRAVVDGGLPDPDSEIEKAKRTAARENCRFCQGSGFRFVAGEHGSTGAYPLPTTRHQTSATAVWASGWAPVVAVQYARDQREAVDRHDAWLRRRPAPDQKGFPKITQAEVDALVAGRS